MRRSDERSDEYSLLDQKTTFFWTAWIVNWRKVSVRTILLFFARFKCEILILKTYLEFSLLFPSNPSSWGFYLKNNMLNFWCKMLHRCDLVYAHIHALALYVGSTLELAQTAGVLILMELFTVWLEVRKSQILIIEHFTYIFSVLWLS